MTLDDIIDRARAGRAMVVFTAPSGVGIHLVEKDQEMDEELQRDLWRQAGAFYICGGEVVVNAAWTVCRHPVTPEAERIAKRLGLPVTAYVARPPLPRVRH